MEVVRATRTSDCQLFIMMQHILFHQVPLTAGWTEASWTEKFAQHLCTKPAVGVKPQTILPCVLSIGPRAPIVRDPH